MGLLLSGGGFDGEGDDFCDVSLGSNALYISFLRGFSGAMRNVFTGASEDEVFEVGRDVRCKFSFGSFRSPSGSDCASLAAGGSVAFGGRLDDAEGGGREGFTNVGGSGLRVFVVFGASLCFSGGIEGFVNSAGFVTRGFVALGACRDFSSGIEGFTNCGGSGLCGSVCLGASRSFSGAIEGFGGSDLCGFAALGASRSFSGRGCGMGSGF